MAGASWCVTELAVTNGGNATLEPIHRSEIHNSPKLPLNGPKREERPCKAVLLDIGREWTGIMVTRIIPNTPQRFSTLTASAAGRLASRVIRGPILNAIFSTLLVVLPVGNSPASVLPADGWTFFNKTSNQQMPGARYRSSDLFGSLTFDTKSRQWRLLLVSGYDLPLPGGITLRAVYDEDKTRNRPHRIETLDVEPQPLGSLPPEIKNGVPSTASARIIQLTLPRTFIIHLQGADRVIVDAGSFQHTMAMRGSAKAIAQIYVALGEGRSSEGKTITETVNKSGSTVDATVTPDTIQVAMPEHNVAATSSTPIAEPKNFPTFQCGELQIDADLESYFECVNDYVSLLKTIEGTKYYKTMKGWLTDHLSYDLYTYSEPKYPINSKMQTCVEFISFVEERSCLQKEKIRYFDYISDRYDVVYAMMPLDFLGPELKEELDGTFGRLMEPYEKFKAELEERQRELSIQIVRALKEE